MSERVPCVISGCRRTFKREHFPHGIVMCSRHYRCDLELCRLFKSAAALVRKLRRRFPHIQWPCSAKWAWVGPPGDKPGRTVAKTMCLAERRMERRWRALVLEAQRQQDAGFFAPRPRSRGAARPVERKSKIEDRFEREFKRLKTARGGF